MSCIAKVCTTGIAVVILMGIPVIGTFSGLETGVYGLAGQEQADIRQQFDRLDEEKISRMAEMFALMYEVDPDLVLAVIAVESDFDRFATSHKGARGVMQIMPSTGDFLGAEDLSSLNDNIEAGVVYLSRMLNRFGGDVSLALAAYNAGPGNVERYGGVPPFPETQQYIRRVLQRYAALRR